MNDVRSRFMRGRIYIAKVFELVHFREVSGFDFH